MLHRFLHIQLYHLVEQQEAAEIQDLTIQSIDDDDIHNAEGNILDDDHYSATFQDFVD